MCCHPLLPSCISLAQLTHVDGVARLLAVGARQLTLVLPLLPISAVLLTSSSSSTELMLPPLMPSLHSILLAILPQWSSAVSHEVSGLSAVVGALRRSSSSSLASSPSVRTAGTIVTELLASVATHVAQIWPLLGPAAKSGSSRSAAVRLRTTERLATLPCADDKLGVLPLQSRGDVGDRVEVR